MSEQAEAAGFSPRILLVVGGGIAAYKACELVRLIRKGGGEVTCVLTKGGQQFVTPLSLAALSENQVYTNLFDLKNDPWEMRPLEDPKRTAQMRTLLESEMKRLEDPLAS